MLAEPKLKSIIISKWGKRNYSFYDLNGSVNMKTMCSFASFVMNSIDRQQHPTSQQYDHHSFYRSTLNSAQSSHSYSYVARVYSWLMCFVLYLYVVMLPLCVCKIDDDGQWGWMAWGWIVLCVRVRCGYMYRREIQIHFNWHVYRMW